MPTCKLINIKTLYYDFRPPHLETTETGSVYARDVGASSLMPHSILETGQLQNGIL